MRNGSRINVAVVCVVTPGDEKDGRRAAKHMAFVCFFFFFLSFLLLSAVDLEDGLRGGFLGWPRGAAPQFVILPLT